MTLPGVATAQTAGSTVPVPTPTPATSGTAIVPDPEFNAQLPPIGTDLNAPLGPMPSLPPPTTFAQPQSQPTPVPPADATITPVPPPSPELAQPLPPLETYSTTPPSDLADITSDDTTVIRYDTVVTGLDELKLTPQFNGLSALKRGGGKAANAAMISARAKEDETLAVRLLRSLGYYDAAAISAIEKNPSDPGRVRAVLTATPGKLYTLGSVTVVADPVTPPDLITGNLPLRVGDPIDAVRVQAAEANVALKMPQTGYPFVKVGQRDVLLDDQAFTGAYTLPVAIGPRSSFGDIQVAGDPVFKPDHIRILRRFKPGDLYDVRKVDDLRQALVASSLFSNIAVEPVDTGQTAPDGTELVDLKITQQKGKTRSLAASAGYSTGQGFRLEGTYTARNAFPPEGALIAGLIAGTQEQGASFTFRRSNAGKRDRTFTLIASANHSNYDAFNAFTGTLSARMSYDSTPIWQKRVTYFYGIDLIGTNESVYDFAIGDRRRATYGILALPGQIAFDTSDNLLNPTRGYRLKLQLSPETAVRGGFRPYARALIEGSVYVPLGTSLVIAGRARAGSILGIDRDDLAPSRRYYGGGGGSVRGYGYQRLGPFDPQGNPIGGRSLNEFAIEARYRFGNFGIVPFFDAGNSYASMFPKLQDLRFGAGIGGRFYTNFGPLRLDLATPLNRRPGDGRVALYISIGQAF